MFVGSVFNTFFIVFFVHLIMLFNNQLEEIICVEYYIYKQIYKGKKKDRNSYKFIQLTYTISSLYLLK